MPRLITALMLALGLLGTFMLGACAAQPSLTYQQAYDQRNYAQALKMASDAAEKPGASETERERALLIAGMSAQALNQPASARKYLNPLRTSANPDIAGRATTSLGLLAAQQGDNRAAGQLLSSGAKKLDGDDAAMAKLHAGAAFERMGMHELAMQQYAAGIGETTNPALRTMLESRNKPTSYYVQTGAFSTRKAAEQAASTQLRTVVKKGERAPIVVENKREGRVLYAIQIGPYPSRDLANGALARLGGKGTVIARRGG